LCLAGALLGASGVSAQSDDVAAAANAFSQAQRAELAGDTARAAELYELADGIAPTPEALRSAARSWFSANRPVPAATDAEELLRRYGNDPSSRQLAEEILEKTRPQLGRLQVSCAAPCTLNVDGLAVATEARDQQTVYLEPGPHTLTARFDNGETKKQRLEARAGESVTTQLAPDPHAAPMTVAAPTATPEPAATAPRVARDEEPGRRRLSPAYFWVGLSATAALGAVTIWSGVDLLHARDDFKSTDNPTRKAFDAGESKDLRTSLLIAGTATLAATTTVLAFFTDFKGKRGHADRARNGTRGRRLSAVHGERAVWGLGGDGHGGHFVLRKAF